jgi:3-deoxy-manno-octulosonate cytidylyltransferase (CMP-KDO synthetase)
MTVVGIIPSRYGSTRFPGKPLVEIQGKSMIQRVYEQCQKSSMLNEIAVATDDQRIYDHVTGFGGNVFMTSADHMSGTDRCAEVIAMHLPNATHIINIQGDEPFIEPAQIDLLTNTLLTGIASIATLVKITQSEEELKNPNVVKVIRDFEGKAIYFSRAAVPYRRNPEANITYYKHLGIYGYTHDCLLKITQLPAGSLEQAEALEQLRWIEAGLSIITAITETETISIDSPADLARVEKMMKS